MRGRGQGPRRPAPAYHGMEALPSGQPRADEFTFTDDKPMQGGKQPVTTLMLRNVPNALTPENLMAIIDMAGFRGTYDYLYLPRDANTAYNKGYGFLNFPDPYVAQEFAKNLEGSAWNERSPKRLAITEAKCQGVAANLRRLRSSATGLQTAAAFSPWLRSKQGYMVCVPASEAVRAVTPSAGQGPLQAPGRGDKKGGKGGMGLGGPPLQGDFPGGYPSQDGGLGPPPTGPPVGAALGPPGGPSGPPGGPTGPPPQTSPIGSRTDVWDPPRGTGATAPLPRLGGAAGPWAPPAFAGPGESA